MQLEQIIKNQKEWSLSTFGKGERTKGIIFHCKLELEEIAKAPDDVTEWADLMILAMDGAWRAGHTPAQIVKAIVKKQRANAKRQWPKNVPQDKPILHIKN